MKLSVASGQIVFTQDYQLTLLEQLAPTKYKQIIIISDDNVAGLYAQQLKDSLTSHGYTAYLISFAAGEASKNAQVKQEIEQQMFELGIKRQALCIACGGGVVGDLAGFVAATFMRGIDYVQIPTSLLAMVDSSVGGKTGINTSYGKNLIGAFKTAQFVIIDTNLLNSLPQVHINNGMFELIKTALIADSNLFTSCAINLAAILTRDFSSLTQLIHSAVAIKAAIVMRDEFEHGERMILNFGHTIAHALESATNYSLLHGYAVGLGMLVEAKIACLSGVLTEQAYQQIAKVLLQLGINPQQLQQIAWQQLLSYLMQDKKNTYQQINFVLLNNIGSVYQVEQNYVHGVAVDMIEAAYKLVADGI